MGDVGEGAGMDEGRLLFQRLEQVGHDGVLHQHSHGAGHAEILCGDGLWIADAVVSADHDAPDAFPHILQACGEGQDSHQLAGHRDVKACLAQGTISLVAQAHDDVAYRPIIDIHDTVPGDRVGVDVELLETFALEEGIAPAVFVVDAGVDGGGAEVVGHADCVNVAREVQIEVLHGHDLAVAPARSTTLDAERGPHRWLTDCSHGSVPQMSQRLSQANRGGGLALAQRGGGYGRHVNIPGGGTVSEFLLYIQMDLGFVSAVEFEIILGESDGCCDLCDGAEFRGLGDVDICGYGFSFLDCHSTIPPLRRS